ncbi:5-formyltetrahydrofolate cyclo-ligase [Actinobacillus arthritidis]|uniref:5-formyltetrahydrofolate cyclo-ligase n=1 Tax=Actinobacillus arthritidis TaxID=157339 RepID=UPI0024424B7F|nr:5-formyltetrahydrofolate cyclo-ligase [Actinobacillus arthritidis]WGE88746.1 5-formyltetrahydrofolate cyclo-ligase [Actinobacillus arthritidis]
MQTHQMPLRKQFRQIIQAERAKLSPDQQITASLNLIPKALALINHYRAEHIALYLPFNHEISPLPLIDNLLALGKSVYLPVLHPFAKGHLLFLKYDSSCVLETHRFGMLQPKLDVRNVKPLTELDMIFTPLLACDLAKNRLGYGGGFYDRTLAMASAKTISVGLAHQCQLIEQVPTEPWDIPLNHLVIGEII